MAPVNRRRNKLRQFKSQPRIKAGISEKASNNVIEEHNYTSEHMCLGFNGCNVCCPGLNKLNAAKKISTNDSILKGRRIVEFSVLIEGLSNCVKCLCGPLYLSPQTVKAEMKVGLAGYLYVQCTYCGNVNRVPYGKKQKKVTGQRGMPSFCVNTKLGAAMIDSVGGPQRMNNFLATLNLPTVNNKNLKVMERRAGEMIEKFADKNMTSESQKAFREEMIEVAAWRWI